MSAGQRSRVAAGALIATLLLAAASPVASIEITQEQLSQLNPVVSQAMEGLNSLWSALDPICPNLDTAAPNLQDELTATVLNIQSAILSACLDGNDPTAAAADIATEVDALVASVFAGVDVCVPGASAALAGGFDTSLITSAFDLDTLCPAIQASSSGVGGGDGGLDIGLGGSTPMPGEGGMPTMPSMGNSTGEDDDTWGCPDDPDAEAALLAACPAIDSTLLASVKAGEAPVAALVAGTSDALLASCQSSCLEAIQMSPCVGGETTGYSTMICGCHAVLPEACAGELASMVPVVISMDGLDMESVMANPEAANDPGLAAMVSSSQGFCSSCQETIKTTEECAMVHMMTGAACCTADIVSSGCAAKMAEMSSKSEEETSMMMMSPEMLSVMEAFADEGEAADMTANQRLNKLKQAGMNTVADLMMTPFKGYCSMMKPGSPMMDMMECSMKGMCMAQVMADAMAGMGDAMGGGGMGPMEGSGGPGDMPEIPDMDTLIDQAMGGMKQTCEKSEEACVRTTMDVCLSGSLNDTIALMEDVGMARRKLMQSPGDSPTEGMNYELGGMLTGLVQGVLGSVMTGAGSGNMMAKVANVAGSVCSNACSKRLNSCAAAKEMPGMSDLVGPQRTMMCSALGSNVPKFIRGAKARLVRMKSVLQLDGVEAFTDALRMQYIQDVAAAANVDKESVNITSITPGSLIVETAIIVKGETDNAVDAYVEDLKEALAKPEEVFDAALGAVEVEVKPVETPDLTQEGACLLCAPEPEQEEDPEDDSHALAATPLALALLSAVAAALLG